MIAGRYVGRGLAAALIVVLAVIMAGCSSPSTTAPSSTTTQAAAVKLVFMTQPVGAEAGLEFAAPPAVAAVDSNGNVVESARALVNLTVTGDPGARLPTLYGGTKALLENGVHNFTGLSLRTAGTFTLTADSDSLTSAVSAPFEITPSTGVTMYFNTTIVGSRAGSPFTVAPQIMFLDNYGNKATGSTSEVSLVLLPDYYNLDKGGDFIGTATAGAVNGVVNFPDLSINRAGDFTIQANCKGMPSIVSGYFAFGPAAPASLVFSTQPKSAVAPGSPLTVTPPAIAVAAKDIYGNGARDADLEISIAITPGTGAPGAVLSGVTTLGTKYGVADFEGLSIDKAGTGYTLTATGDGLVSAVSDPFDITPEAATTTTETTETTTP